MPTITFRRASNVQNIPITDGQIIFDTSRNIILMDNGNVRNQYAGATQLISTTPEATSTNAFNALASTQLFLQKTTVIDTKANALAVNQNYIPLGCLAFKEALGTVNYSSIGNGTISGALVTLNNQLSVSGNKFYFDYQNGKYGYNTEANRGADTFHPFSDMTEIYNAVVSKGVTPASDSPEDIAAAIRQIITDVKHNVHVRWWYRGDNNGPTFGYEATVDGVRVGGSDWSTNTDWYGTV